MSTTQTQIKTCPGCGAKLPDVALSICPYCVTPLGITPKADGKESPYAARITRILAHDTLAEAMAWTPAEGPEFVRGGQLVFRGKLIFVIGAILSGACILRPLVDGSFVFDPLNVLFVIGIAFISGGTFLIRQGKGVRTAATSKEMLRRPGVIVDRRSEITLQGMGGCTTYFFEIEFEGGLRGEFTWPGRGINTEPYTSNLPGDAFTRGVELVYFKHIRV